MMTSKNAAALASAAIVFSAFSLARGALVEVSTDAFDVSQGGSILTGTSPTVAGFDAVAAIGGPNGGGEGGNGGLGDDTIFSNGGLNDLIFQRTSTYPLTAANLFNSADGQQNGGFRSTSSLTLYAGTYAGGVFTPTTTLVDGAAVTANDGSGSQFVFATPTTATVFEAVFDGNGGERIVELDAVPEPVALGLLGLAGLGFFGRRPRDPRLV